MPLSRFVNGTLPRNHGVIPLKPQSFLRPMVQSSAEEPRQQQVAQPGSSRPGRQIPVALGDAEDGSGKFGASWVSALALL